MWTLSVSVSSSLANVTSRFRNIIPLFTMALSMKHSGLLLMILCVGTNLSESPPNDIVTIVNDDEASDEPAINILHCPLERNGDNCFWTKGFSIIGPGRWTPGPNIEFRHCVPTNKDAEEGSGVDLLSQSNPFSCHPEFRARHFGMRHQGEDVESISNGKECVLLIYNANIEDVGDWVCNNETHFHIVHVEVIDEPLKPTLSNDKRRLDSGQEDQVASVGLKGNKHILYCISEDGLPRPESFDWSIGGQSITEMSEVYISHSKTTDKITAKSKLILDISKLSEDIQKAFRDSEVLLTCSVGHKALNKPQNVSIEVYGKVPLSKPILHYTYPLETFPFVGKFQPKVSITCTAHSRPPPVKYTIQWIDRANYFQPVSSGKSPHATAAYPGRYKCSVETEDGDKRGGDLFSVADELYYTSVVSVDVGSKKTFECNLVNAANNGSCFWIRLNDDPPLVILSTAQTENQGYKIERGLDGESCHLTIESVTGDDGGFWQCVTMNSERYQQPIYRSLHKLYVKNM